MKFGQLIEYNIRIISVEKSHTKSAGETIPIPLSKKSKLSKYLDQQCKVLNSLLYCMLIWGLSRYNEIKLHDHRILVNEYQRNYDFIMSKYVT